MDKGDVSRTLCGLGLLPSSVCYFYMAEALRLSLREPDRLLLSELAHRHLTEKPSVSELLSLLTIYLRAEEEN